MLFLTNLIFDYKNAFAEIAPESSGNSIQVETPDITKASNYVLVQKPNGKQSLIMINAGTINDTILQRSKGKKGFRE